MYLQGSFPIASFCPITGDTFDVLLNAPQMAENALPGQFCHIKLPGFFLRRPISICEVDQSAGTLRLIFQIRGAGTAEMASTKIGDLWDVMGPIGSGFHGDCNKTVAVVGGGIGVPPLLEAAKHHTACKAFLGFRSKDAVILAEDFAALGETVITTDDGSYGLHGFCVQPFEAALAQGGIDLCYACGPMVMLRRVAELCRQYGVPAQLSLEERMGCGVGACLGCAAKIKAADGEIVHRRVCVDGPVFAAEEVVFDE